MKRLHSHHTPEGRKKRPVELVRTVEFTETGLLLSIYPVKRRKP